MFVIELVYKVDLATIDAEMRAHAAWLRTTMRREPSWRQAARSLAAVASFRSGYCRGDAGAL